MRQPSHRTELAVSRRNTCARVARGVELGVCRHGFPPYRSKTIAWNKIDAQKHCVRPEITDVVSPKKLLRSVLARLTNRCTSPAVGRTTVGQALFLGQPVLLVYAGMFFVVVASGVFSQLSKMSADCSSS